MKPTVQDLNIQPILNLYSLQITSAICIDPLDGGSRWLLETNKGPKILRKLAVKPARMLFFTSAHQHLLQNGFPITNIQLTKHHGLCVSAGGDAYIMYDKHAGSTYSYFNPNHLSAMMNIIGTFHQASKGYQAPTNSKKRKRLGKYQKLYQWKIQELEGNKMLAQAYGHDSFSTLFLDYADLMIERAKQSLKEIEEPPYQQWMEQVKAEGGFCQQDVKLSQFINLEGQPFMAEIPSIILDLPTRDVRVLLNKVMLKLGVWDTELARRMLQAYEGVHPLTESQYEVLRTDLRFPYHFCTLVHQYYLHQQPSWSSDKYTKELQRIIEMEVSKHQFLDTFGDEVAYMKEIGGKHHGES